MSLLRFLRCLCRVRHARTLTLRMASLIFFSRTPILVLTRASAGGRDRAAGLFSSSTLWIRYCALMCRASSASTFSTFAYENGVDALSSSIFATDAALWLGSNDDDGATRRRRRRTRRSGEASLCELLAAGRLSWDVCACYIGWCSVIGRAPAGWLSPIFFGIIDEIMRVLLGQAASMFINIV